MVGVVGVVDAAERIDEAAALRLVATPHAPLRGGLSARRVEAAAVGDLRRLADDLSEADDVEAESGAPLQRHPLLELPPRLLGSEDAAAAARLGHPQRRGRRR